MSVTPISSKTDETETVKDAPVPPAEGEATAEPVEKSPLVTKRAAVAMRRAAIATLRSGASKLQKAADSLTGLAAKLDSAAEEEPAVEPPAEPAPASA